MPRILLLALLSLAALFQLTSCATNNQPRRVTEENVSQIPWNRPERWESGGMMGGMMGQ